MKLRHFVFVVGVLTWLSAQLYFIKIISRLDRPLYSGPLSFNLTALVASFVVGVGSFSSQGAHARRLFLVFIASIMLGGCIIIRWLLPYNHVVQFLIIAFMDISVAIYVWDLLESRFNPSTNLAPDK